MKRLLVIFLLAIFCKSKGQDGIRDTSIIINRIDTLKIDERLLSNIEKQYLKTVDSLTAAIDSKSIFTQTIKNERGQIDGYSEKQNGIVNKIIASGKSIEHDVVYSYYYLDEKVVKVTSLEKFYPPFCSTIYFLGDKAIIPPQLSQRSADAVKIQSVQFLILFNKK